jgi:hypothetical protein
VQVTPPRQVKQRNRIAPERVQASAQEPVLETVRASGRALVRALAAADAQPT